jgi:hypothetical protein
MYLIILSSQSRTDTWGYKVLSVAQALSRWATRVGRDPKRAYIWICSLCLNQHRIGGSVVSPEDLANEFGPRVQSIGRILPMLEPWKNPGKWQTAPSPSHQCHHATLIHWCSHGPQST